MMTRRPLFLLTLLALAAPAQALKLSVWDRELQTKLGDGESSGGKFTVRLVGDYDGPVVILFAQTDDERTRGVFPNLKSRYNGLLSGGQLTVQAPAPAQGDRPVSALSAGNSGLTLAKFLAGFRLSLSVQSAGQSLSLPGLKTPDAPK